MSAKHCCSGLSSLCSNLDSWFCAQMCISVSISISDLSSAVSFLKHSGARFALLRYSYPTQATDVAICMTAMTLAAVLKPSGMVGILTSAALRNTLMTPRERLEF
jgi:hypothetical protein